MRERQLRWSAAACAVVAVVTVACSGGAGPVAPPASVPDTAPGPPGTAAPGSVPTSGAPAPEATTDEGSFIENEEVGFGVALPAGWRAVVLDAGTRAEVLGGGGPKAAELEQVLGRENARGLVKQGGVLVAYDAAAPIVSLKVVRVPTSGATVESLAQSLPGEYRALGFREVQVEIGNLPAGRAVRATGIQRLQQADGTSVDFFQLEYYFVAGEATFILKFNTPDPGQDTAILDEIGQSLKVG